MGNEENEENKRDWVSTLSNAIIIVEYTARLISHISNVYYNIWKNNRKSPSLTCDVYGSRNGGVILPENLNQLLVQDKEAENEKCACKICLTNEIKTINLNCGHLVFCFECTKRCAENGDSKCPICRQELIEIKQIFD
jgi:hypothetical protein